MSIDLLLWWLGFLLTTGLIPTILIAYLRSPAQIRRRRTEEAINRFKDAAERAAIATDDKESAIRENVKETLGQYTSSAYLFIEDFYDRKYYIFPVCLLTLVLGIGFFLMFSSAYPLYKLQVQVLDDLLLAIPAPVFYGFLGGWFYSLYSVVNRYRSSDIPSGLVLQLAFQVLISGAVAYFLVTVTPEAFDAAAAFAVGFVPYRKLTGWFQRMGEKRLAAIKIPGLSPKPKPPAGGKEGVPEKQEPESKNLSELQGVTREHKERLEEEGILTIQNLALTNPLSLFLVTSYRMSQIIDWIDQAYLRIYVNAEAAALLAPMGIRGIIELKEAIDDLSKEEFLESLAKALKTDKTSAKKFVKQFADDPHAILLDLMWKEFGGA